MQATPYITLPGFLARMKSPARSIRRAPIFDPRVLAEQLRRHPAGAIHVPALDGFRGLAILLVLFCHAVQQDAAGLMSNRIDSAILTVARVSWTGVDMFFVLSGYLITGILYDARGANHFFRNFYARRVLRIFPLYYVSLALFLVFLPMLPAAFVAHFGVYRGSQAWYWAYLSNFSQAIIREREAFLTTHIVAPTWSLAVEEHFYLVWPLVVFFFERKTLLKICAGMFFGAMLLRAGLEFSGYTYIAIYTTPCRVDGLAMGAAIALIARGPRGIRSLVSPAKYLLPVSALLIGANFALMAKMGYHRGPGYSPGYVVFSTGLFACLYGSLLVLTISSARGGLLERFFSQRVMRAFGKYSYAIYLLHMPVIVMVGDFVFSPAQWKIGGSHLPSILAFCAVTFALSLLIAIVSWHVLEKHCLKLKKYFPMRPSARNAPTAI